MGCSIRDLLISDVRCLCFRFLDEEEGGGDGCFLFEVDIYSQGRFLASEEQKQILVIVGWNQNFAHSIISWDKYVSVAASVQMQVNLQKTAKMGGFPLINSFGSSILWTCPGVSVDHAPVAVD